MNNGMLEVRDIGDINTLTVMLNIPNWANFERFKYRLYRYTSGDVHLRSDLLYFITIVLPLVNLEEFKKQNQDCI